MKVKICLWAMLSILLFMVMTAFGADLSKEETLNYIREKLSRSNVKGISGIPWFPEYDQPRTELTAWEFRISGESVELTARVEGPKRENRNYIHIIEIKFDIDKIKNSSWGESRVTIYFDGDDLSWEVKKHKFVNRRIQRTSTHSDEDDSLEIHLSTEKDGRRLGKAFNYYSENWGLRAPRGSASRSGSRERDPFDD
jgi:hypothetical protein